MVGPNGSPVSLVDACGKDGNERILKAFEEQLLESYKNCTEANVLTVHEEFAPRRWSVREHKDLSVFVGIPMSDIGFVHELSEVVLNGDLEMRVGETLGLEPGMIKIDKSYFARSYEKAVLRLDKLTPHQEQAMVKCRPVLERNGRKTRQPSKPCSAIWRGRCSVHREMGKLRTGPWQHS